MRESRSSSYLLVLISCYSASNGAAFNSTPLHHRVRRPIRFDGLHPSASATRRYASNNNDADEASAKRRKNNSRQTSTPSNRKTTRRKNYNNAAAAATMNTAVCIIPPDDAWDAIQRARHLARDTTFYKWPPAIRLFHPFAPQKSIPSLVGKLAEWIEEEGTKSILEMELRGSDEYSVEEHVNGAAAASTSTIPLLESFEVTLDSITILPHWEILDARIEALEERMPQRTLGESLAEKESRLRRAEGMRLIEEEEMKGLARKKERERKKMLKRKKQSSDIDDQNDDDDTTNDEDGETA